MIKGCQKKMIVLRCGESKYFAEAFFVLRDTCDGAVSNADMVSEANRIVEESLRGLPPHTRKRKRLSRRGAAAISFAGGALLASAVSLLIRLLA